MRETIAPWRFHPTMGPGRFQSHGEAPERRPRRPLCPYAGGSLAALGRMATAPRVDTPGSIDSVRYRAAAVSERSLPRAVNRGAQRAGEVPERAARRVSNFFPKCCDRPRLEAAPPGFRPARLPPPSAA